MAQPDHEMTQEQKRIKIAEACGLTGWQETRSLPDYFKDLNAMHEAEKVLSDFNHGLFRKLLFSEAYNIGLAANNLDAERKQVSATAAARAEAFGKTLNLW